jgi:hypothetical protein
MRLAMPEAVTTFSADPTALGWLRSVHGNSDLPIGPLRAILRQADLTPDDLAELL